MRPEMEKTGKRKSGKDGESEREREGEAWMGSCFRDATVVSLTVTFTAHR